MRNLVIALLATLPVFISEARAANEISVETFRRDLSGHVRKLGEAAENNFKMDSRFAVDQVHKFHFSDEYLACVKPAPGLSQAAQSEACKAAVAPVFDLPFVEPSVIRDRQEAIKAIYQSALVFANQQTIKGRGELVKTAVDAIGEAYGTAINLAMDARVEFVGGSVEECDNDDLALGITCLIDSFEVFLDPAADDGFEKLILMPLRKHLGKVTQDVLNEIEKYSDSAI